jgi:Cu-processing system permease protein
MGYTGAIFKDFFGTQEGILISFSMLILWAVIPFILSAKKFKSKDL